jgi:hypothetical protein
MDQDNLAAAILRYFGSQVVCGQLESLERLTNEEAINLADWLRRESSIDTWRSIHLTQSSAVGESSTRASGRNSTIRQIK